MGRRKNATLRMLLIPLAVLPAAAVPAQPDPAGRYPERPITYVIPYPPGGPTDAITRLIMEELGKRLGQPVIITNKAGAGGNIGMAAVLRSKPDGYTLVSIATSTAMKPVLYKSLPYEPAHILPVSIFASTSYVLTANPRLAASDLADLFALIRSRPGKFNAAYASTTAQIGNAVLKRDFGLEFTDIPYKGDAEATNAVISGEVDFCFSSSQAVPALARRGLVRPIAIASAHRSTRLPALPTFAESGYARFVDLDAWLGVATVAGTPPGIVRRLNAEINRIVSSAAVAARMRELGLTPTVMDQDAAAGKMRRDAILWRRLARQARIAAQ